MQQNNLVKILKKLSIEEVRTFQKHIKRQYKPDSQMVLLMDYLKKNHRQLDGAELKAERVFKKVIGNRIFKKRQLQNLFSELFSEFKQFIVQNRIVAQPVAFNFELLEFYKSHGLYNLFEKQLWETEMVIDDMECQIIWFWQYQMRLAHNRYYSLMSNKKKGENLYIFQALTALDHFHAVAKLKFACEIYSGHQIVAIEKIEIQFLEALMKESYSDLLLHQSFQLALKMIIYKDDIDYRNLKELLLSRYAEICDEDQHILFTYLLNHASHCIRSGKKEYLEESLDLFKFAINQDFFVSDGYFNQDHFANIVDIGCQLREYNWVESFIQRKKAFLKPKISRNYLKFAKAQIAFSKGQYKNAFNFIEVVRTENPFFELRIRWLMLATRYERNEDLNYLLTECLKLEEFVQKSQGVGESVKTAVLTSSKILRSLLDPNVDKEKLREKFLQSNNYYHQSWLEKILK